MTIWMDASIRAVLTGLEFINSQFHPPTTAYRRIYQRHRIHHYFDSSVAQSPQRTPIQQPIQQSDGI